MPKSYEALIARPTDSVRPHPHRCCAGLLLLVLVATGCGGRMPPRTADTARPVLTAERIDRVVQVAEQLRPGHAELARYLDDPDISIGYDFTEHEIVPAKYLVGTDGMATLSSLGEDPQAYVRDVFWIRLAASAVRNAGTVDEKMREIRRAESRMSLMALVSGEVAGLRESMRTLLHLHARIGRGEEEAVRARLSDIDRVAFRYLQRNAALRDSLARMQAR